MRFGAGSRSIRVPAGQRPQRLRPPLAAVATLVGCVSLAAAHFDAGAASAAPSTGGPTVGVPGAPAKPARARNGPIAFVGSTANGRSIFRVGSRGGGLRQLTTGATLDFSPAASPDGRLVAFTRLGHSGSVNIFTVPAGGGEVKQVTDAATGIASATPTWSPNGSTIAFTRGPFNGRAPGEIYRMRLDGSQLQQLTRSTLDDTDAAWAPRGRRIAFVRGTPPHSSIWTMRPNGKGKRRLTGLHSGTANPSWSPNGKWIAYEQSSRRGSAIHLMRRDGTRRKRLTPRKGIHTDPAFSPNGRRIAFAGGPSSNRLHLFTMTRRGTKVRSITPRRTQTFEPTWLPRP